MTKKDIKPSLPTRIADKLEGKTPALAAPFRFIGNRLDLNKLEKAHPRLGKWTRAEYDLNKLEQKKEDAEAKLAKRYGGITRDEQEAMSKTDKRTALGWKDFSEKRKYNVPEDTRKKMDLAASGWEKYTNAEKNPKFIAKKEEQAEEYKTKYDNYSKNLKPEKRKKNVK